MKCAEVLYLFQDYATERLRALVMRWVGFVHVPGIEINYSQLRYIITC